MFPTLSLASNDEHIAFHLFSVDDQFRRVINIDAPSMSSAELRIIAGTLYEHV